MGMRLVEALFFHLREMASHNLPYIRCRIFCLSVVYNYIPTLALELPGFFLGAHRPLGPVSLRNPLGTARH